MKKTLSFDEVIELYNTIISSDNLTKIRSELHRKCDYIDFSELFTRVLGLKEMTLKVDRIKKEYDSMIEAEKTIYKISPLELENRIKKLKIVAELYETCSNPYIRFDKMRQMFKNPSALHKSYILLIRYGKEDPALDEIRPILKNFNYYYKDFKDSFKNEVHNTVVNAYNDEFDLLYNNYAEFIANEYLNDNTVTFIEPFLHKYDLSKEQFNEILEYLKKNNRTLYYEYLIKKCDDDKKANYINKANLEYMAYQIKNEEFFRPLDFIKKVPFKDSEEFVEDIYRFMVFNNMSCIDTIMSYIKENKLDNPDSFKILNKTDLYSKSIIIDGETLEGEDIRIITIYLMQREIPLYKSAFIAACKMYINKVFGNNVYADDLTPRDIYTPIIVPLLKK